MRLSRGGGVNIKTAMLFKRLKKVLSNGVLGRLKLKYIIAQDHIIYVNTIYKGI